jgi:hypothetical protein
MQNEELCDVYPPLNIMVCDSKDSGKMLQIFVYAYSLMKGVTFMVVLLSSCTFNPEMLTSHFSEHPECPEIVIPSMWALLWKEPEVIDS